MAHLSVADWFVIVAYLVGVIWFGVRLGHGQKSTRDYFLGNRGIAWWGVGLSIVATETSALTFIGVPAAAYGGNLGFIQIIVGYVIARIILAVVMVPHYFKGEIYSPYQMLGEAFGSPVRKTASLFFLIAGTLAAGVRIYVTCIPLQLMLGFADNQVIFAILLFVVLSLIYTYVGGVKAVIWTDAIQFVLLAGGGLFALFYIPTKLAGGWGAAIDLAAANGKLAWFNGHFSLAAPYNIWMGLIGATFQVMSSHGADQLVVQRVLSCRSVADGRRSLILSAIIILPLFLLFLFVGVLLWSYYQLHTSAIPLPEARPGVGKNDYVFPIFILTEMPPVMRGFLIVAILSAAMSSVSSALSALSSVSTMDLLRNWLGQNWNEHRLLQFSKRSTLVWAGVLVLVAWWSQHTRSVLDLAFSLNGLTAGGMLGALLLLLWWKRGSPWPVVIGMFASLGFMLWLSNFSWPAVESSGALVTKKVYWPWYTLAGTLVTFIIARFCQPFWPRKPR
ncbi:sodium/solute symporter [bacterium]|nr:sodium/solute symporter [bacterium]